MTGTTVIRPARPDDAGALLDLIDALADYEKLDRPDEAARERLTRDIFGPRPRIEVLLAFDGDTAVGYALFLETYSSFLARPTLYLEDIFVHPDARGRRIGLTLMRQLATLALERDCGRMEWVVLRWNTPAIDFYDRLGAVPMKEWETFRLDRDGLERVSSGAGKPRPPVT